MDLKYNAEEQKFRAEVRAFFDAELPADIRTKLQLGRRISKDDMVRWQKILFRKGWGAPNWPKSFGGTGWDIVQQHIFEEERADACAPGQNPFSLKMLAPVMQTFGNAANSLGRTLGVQQGQESNYTALQAAVQNHSQTAAGQMQAIQATNEALGVMNMSDRPFTAMFVVENGQPIGIVSVHDLLRAGVM